MHNRNHPIPLAANLKTYPEDIMDRLLSVRPNPTKKVDCCHDYYPPIFPVFVSS